MWCSPASFYLCCAPIEGSRGSTLNVCSFESVWQIVNISSFFPFLCQGEWERQGTFNGRKNKVSQGCFSYLLTSDLTDIWKDLSPPTYFFSPLSQTSPIRTSWGADAIIIKCFMWFGFTVAPLREALASAARPNKSMGKISCQWDYISATGEKSLN